jgi:hypothetical protein
MAATAVATTAPLSHLATTAVRSVERRESAAQRFAATAIHFIHRARAKFAFHDATRYRNLVARVARFIPAADRPDQLGGVFRRLDRDGLGVWLLARSRNDVSLVDLCRRAIATPGVGPPRAIAQLLEQSLVGRPVRWFGDRTDCDLLGATTLLGSAIVASLVAGDLASVDDRPDWASAQSRLTSAASALQSTVRSLRRVHGGASESDRAAALLYQAANIARRALNRTDLLSVDAKLATEVIHLALAAGQAANSAALELLVDSTDVEPSIPHSARDRFRALARGADAVLARCDQLLRRGAVSDARDEAAEQVAQVLSDVCLALASHGVELPAIAHMDLCGRAGAVVQSTAELLDAWTVGQTAVDSPDDASPAGSQRHRGDEWPSELQRCVSGGCTSRQLLDWLHELAAGTSCVRAAVGLSAFRRQSRQLDRELWALIRARDSSPVVRSLALQMFFRLRRLSPATPF